MLSGCGNVYQNTTDPEVIVTEREAKSFSETISSLNNPEHVYGWMQKNIRYEVDTTPSDEFRVAEVTYQLGYGDCDDYAMFADRVLESHGYETQIISVFSENILFFSANILFFKRPFSISKISKLKPNER